MLFKNNTYELRDYINAVPSKFNEEEEKPFNLRIPFTSGWKEYDTRVLFICGHIHPEDIKSRQLLVEDGPSANCLNNLISHAIYTANSQWQRKLKNKEFGVAAINFNFFRNYHLEKGARRKSDQYCAKRVFKYIEKMKPTHVVVFGALPALSMFGEDCLFDVLLVKKQEYGDKKIPTVICPDFAHALDNQNTGSLEASDDEKALSHVYNLGLIGPAIAALMTGDYPWKIKKTKIKPVLIDTIEKFEKFYKKLDKAKIVAVDTEGTSLSAHLNRFQTLQFSFDSTCSYILPVYHRDSTFSKKDFDYIFGLIRKFFMKKVPQDGTHYIMGFNLKYDNKVLRTGFKIPFIYWPLFDIMAGEHQLNENMVSLSSFIDKLPQLYKSDKVKDAKKSLGLAMVARRYGDDFYFTHEFSKAQRVTIAANPLSKPVLEYCSADTQLLFPIRDAQYKRAELDSYVDGKKTRTFKDAFHRMVLFQMSNNIHDFSSMEINGFFTSRSRLRELKKRGGTFDTAMRETLKELYDTKEVKKANRLLLEDKGIVKGSNTLFEPWFFDINKAEHVRMLFVNVMQLEPPLSKKGNLSFGKEFKEMYRKTIPIVEMYANVTSFKQLKSTFVNKFAEHMDSQQGRITHSIIPDFGFATIVTGRANSSNPSLMQIPEHGKMAKVIKAIFVTKKGKLKVKMDYSAHEVRVWGIAAFDKKLAMLFMQGFELRQKLFNATGKVARKILKKLALVGDIHRVNGSFFFGVDVDKVDDEMRQGTKGVVFGAIYGRAAATLAKQLNKAKEYAENLYSMFFGRYVKAKEWLDNAEDQAEQLGFSESPIGRRRRLIGGFLTGLQDIVAAMRRRAKNAPIQGVAADYGHTGARLFEQHILEFAREFGDFDKYSELSPAELDVMVHDSIYSQVDFLYVIPAMFIMQWCATEGVRIYYEEKFNVKFNVPLEIEEEVGTDNAKLYKWNWQWTDDELDLEGVHKKAMPLSFALEKTMADYFELYPEEKERKKEIEKELFYFWNKKEIRKHLMKRYPIMPTFKN